MTAISPPSAAFVDPATQLSGYDVKYAMDNLNRLSASNRAQRADEGTLSGGAITSRQRRELWTLGQTGNWDRRKLDLNGDGAYAAAGELDDSGTFNKANEWLTRDTDTNGSANYTTAHDAAGNLTDDGKDYTFVYDAFGRMTTMKQRLTPFATVAEYAYDGLNQRIGTHTDTNASGAVDSSDPWYQFVYDDRWRIAAVYRVPSATINSVTIDSSPKEQFV